MSNALVDVITGAADPGGRLPTTFPINVKHNPSFGNFPGSNGECRYGEGIYVGYRWYEARELPVSFAFGHGLSYASFDVGAPTISSARIASGETLTVQIPLTNTSNRAGSHVVQCYVAPPKSRLDRPAKELKAFAKVSLAAGASTTVTLTLDERSFAYWDPAQPGWPALQQHLTVTIPQLQHEHRKTNPGWVVEAGVYGILIGNSSADIVHRVNVQVDASAPAR